MLLRFAALLRVAFLLASVFRCAQCQLDALKETTLPSLYEWMERNAYICESPDRSALRFIGDADAVQFNCEQRCGDPLDTLRACALRPSSPREVPECHDVPDICIHEFIQEFILLLREQRASLVRRAFKNDQSNFLSINREAIQQNDLTSESSTPKTISTMELTTATTAPIMETTTLTTTTRTKENETTIMLLASTTVENEFTVDTTPTTSIRLDSNRDNINSTIVVDITTKIMPTTTVNNTVSLPSLNTSKTITIDNNRTEEAAELAELSDALKNESTAELLAELSVIDGEVLSERPEKRSKIVEKLLNKFQSIISPRSGRGRTNMAIACSSEDDHSSCAFWAALNECRKNFSFMRRMCRHACGFCAQNQNASEKIEKSRKSSAQAEREQRERNEIRVT